MSKKLLMEIFFFNINNHNKKIKVNFTVNNNRRSSTCPKEEITSDLISKMMDYSYREMTDRFL